MQVDIEGHQGAVAMEEGQCYPRKESRGQLSVRMVEEKKTPREEYQMLMDHDLHTGLAHYLVTAMKKKQIAPKKKEKKEAAKEKAKQKIAAKKMKARAEKKKTLKKTSSP